MHPGKDATESSGARNVASLLHSFGIPRNGRRQLNRTKLPKGGRSNDLESNVNRLGFLAVSCLSPSSNFPASVPLSRRQRC